MASDVSISPARARRIVQRLIDEDVAERSDVYFMSRRHYNVREIARTAAQIFGGERSQMNALERAALNASTFGDVINHVKSQLGRSTRVGKKWRDRDFGYDLHDELSGLADEAEGHASKIRKGLDSAVISALQRDDESTRDVRRRLDQELERRLRVRYVQAYIGHLVAHFSYLVSLQMEPVHGS
jgi:hypothetical protein